MLTLIKWIATLLVVGLLWLIGKYTVEYFNTKSYNK